MAIQNSMCAPFSLFEGHCGPVFKSAFRHSDVGECSAQRYFLYSAHGCNRIVEKVKGEAGDETGHGDHVALILKRLFLPIALANVAAFQSHAGRFHSGLGICRNTFDGSFLRSRRGRQGE